MPFGPTDPGRNAIWSQPKSDIPPGAQMCEVYQCTRCGHLGHEASDCLAPRRYNGVCNCCGEVGHVQRNCKFNQQPQHQQQQQYQQPAPQMSVPQQSILQQPGVPLQSRQIQQQQPLPQQRPQRLPQRPHANVATTAAPHALLTPPDPHSAPLVFGGVPLPNNSGHLHMLQQLPDDDFSGDSSFPQ